MGYFDSFREDGRNTYHPGTHSAVWADVTQLTVVIICVVFSLALFIVVLGTRGKERLTNFLRLVFTLHSGIVILVSLYSSNWQTAEGMTQCPYGSQDGMDMMAKVTIKVGLCSVNVTLQGTFNDSKGSGSVNYNERFWFIDVDEISRELDEAKHHGLPSTIIYILEYFSVDEGGLRWHRYIRQAGYFTLILLWASFAMWIVFNVIFCFVAVYGAALMTITGVTMVTACILHATLQPLTPLIVPFDDTFATLQKGWCFWLVLVSGLVTMLTGLVLMILCQFILLPVSRVFLIDVTDLEEEEAELRERFATNTDSPENKRKYSIGYANSAFSPEEVDTSPPPTLQMRYRYSIDLDRTTLNGARMPRYNMSAPNLTRYRNTPSLASIFAPQTISRDCERPQVIVENEAGSGSGSDSPDCCVRMCDGSSPQLNGISADTKNQPQEQKTCSQQSPADTNNPSSISDKSLNPDSDNINNTQNLTNTRDNSSNMVHHTDITGDLAPNPSNTNHRPGSVDETHTSVAINDATHNPVCNYEVPDPAITIVDIQEDDDERVGEGT